MEQIINVLRKKELCDRKVNVALNNIQRYIMKPLVLLIEYLRGLKIFQYLRAYQAERQFYNRVRHYRSYSGQEGSALFKRIDLSDYPKVLLVLSRHGWHPDLEQGWKQIARTVCYDPEGYEPLILDYKTVKKHLPLRRAWNEELINVCKKVHLTAQKDVIFIYTNTSQITRECMLSLHEMTGCPTVLMSLDDKNSWEGPPGAKEICALKPLANAVSLYWTSSRECAHWIAAEGGNPMYLPEGANEQIYKPVKVEHQDIDVCFVGAAYGFRKAWINRLKKRGIRVTCFGYGWGRDSYIPQEKIPGVFCRSKVVLGHGGIGYSEILTNVKGRDFEAPMTGGGVYITTFNADLALHYQHGREILFYRNDEECEFHIWQALDHPAEAREMSYFARERSLRMHTWTHRFRTVLDVLRGKIRPADAWKTCAI